MKKLLIILIFFNYTNIYGKKNYGKSSIKYSYSVAYIQINIDIYF